jgi:FkbM family methyltransferase
MFPTLALGRWLLRVRPARLAAWLKRLLRVRRVTVRTSHGLFWIDPASLLGQEIAGRGGFDPDTLAALQRVLRPGDTFIDIGANEGYFSVVAASLVGASGRVVAVEPQSRLREVLRRNFELNACRRIEHVAAAVSDRPGTADLHLAPDVNSGSSGLAAATRYRVPTEIVPTMTLAQLLAAVKPLGAPVVKMDIESWEYEAILGSPEVFLNGRIRALVLELHYPMMRRRGRNPAEVPDFLRVSGYTLAPDSAGLLWVRRAEPSAAPSPRD